MKTLGTILCAMALTVACGTTDESSGGGGSTQAGPYGTKPTTYGCEGLTGQALERCLVRRDAGSANR
jgi:hypothetical protein